MPVVDRLFSIGAIQRAIWRLWYGFVTRRVSADGVVFLNYGFETDPPSALPLDSADEPNRACIQLYHHVASQVDLCGKAVLEVSCGHGGGAAYVTRTLQPAHYTGLDMNPTGVAFCQRRHRSPGLSFIQGEAEKLPFANETFDAVINIEASHCYHSFARFLAEAARMLRPGGHLLYADFRYASSISDWEATMAAAPFRIGSMRVINAEVARGMAWNSRRSADLIARHLPRWLQPLGRGFAGVEGSQIYGSVRRGELSYRSYDFVKPVASCS